MLAPTGTRRWARSSVCMWATTLGPCTGDGNLHLNISTKHYSEELEAALEPFVYQWVADRGGSVSAEHGLGQMKNHMLGCEPQPCHSCCTWC